MAPQGKSDASRIQWNSMMDEHLIGVLKEEHLTGGRHSDGTWKHDALAHAAKEVFDQTGEEVSVEHVRARRRYLQDKYKKARECKEKSGFGWNAATQLFTADSIAWKEFVTEHPKYKSFRSKQVPFYDDLDCIFGEEKVTGLRNFEGSESSTHVEPPLDDCDNENDIEIQPSTSTSPMQTTTSGSHKKRRWMVESMEQNMLMGMVEAAKEIAKALKPQKCNHIERALRQLPDMTDDQVFDGMDLLGPNPQLTEVFFGLSEDSSRKAWLMRRLKRQNEEEDEVFLFDIFGKNVLMYLFALDLMDANIWHYFVEKLLVVTY